MDDQYRALACEIEKDVRLLYYCVNGDRVVPFGNGTTIERFNADEVGALALAAYLLAGFGTAGTEQRYAPVVDLADREAVRLWDGAARLRFGGAVTLKTPGSGRGFIVPVE